MKIAEVKIKNFRCFKNLSLSFSNFQALVGENGTGKTAVLEAINMATSSGLPYLSEQDFNTSDEGDLSVEVIFDKAFLTRVPDGYTTQDIPSKSVILNAHRREKAAAGKALSDPFVIEKYIIPIEYDESHVPEIGIGDNTVNIPRSITKTDKGWESPRKTQGSQPFRFATNRLSFQNEMISFPNIFYFDRDREDQAKVTTFNSLLQKIAKDLNWRYRKGWNQADIEEKWNHFYEAVIAIVEDPKKGRIIQPIREKLKKIAGIDFSDLELSLLDIEQPFLKAFFSRRKNTNQIEQKRFGSGISILIAQFLLETISKLSKENIIILIDEPELHLHPQLQHALFQEFQESKFQTIYTTQSDCFINIAEWQSISRFQLNSEVAPLKGDIEFEIEEKKIFEHLDEIKQWYQHQSLFFREDNQIFFSRKCLLVEGPGEKYGLPVLAGKLKKKLDGITIISCNGKTKIPYYQLLCKAFRIPFYTIFDSDGRREDEDDNKRPYDWAEPTARLMFSTSFEKLLGVSSSSDHKTSELLSKIDGMAVENIPLELNKALGAIENWIGS